jgi:hypothetical protein
MLETQIELSELMPGMTVLFRGKVTTVCKTDIGGDRFMGVTFRGDASKKYLTRVQWVVPTMYGSRLTA